MAADAFRAAAVQMRSGPDVAANLRSARDLIDRAAGDGARLVALPENFPFMGPERQRAGLSEADGDGPLQDFLARAAREAGVVLVGGTIPLAAAEPRRVRPACLVYDDDGRRLARYDKIHLFDVSVPDSPGESYRESDTFEAGSEVVVADSPVGRLGFAVCYDLRFPELFRRLAGEGAEILVVPSAFTRPTGHAHWDILVRARAVENLAWVVAPDQQGVHFEKRETWGRSMIVDPWGRVVARRDRGAGIAAADVRLDRLRELRRKFPCMEHRREDIFSL